MNLRRQANIDKYLYEIIDEYKHSESDEEKNDIFKSFCSSIWSCDNKRRTYIKTIRFSVRKDLLNTDVGQVFDAWSEVEYKGYKSMTKEIDWCSLIRQKVNNLYTRYCDKDVILKKDYMNLLKTPKNLYYRWIDGAEMDADELTNIIDDAINDAERLKVTYQKQKIDLSWNDYKKAVEGFFQRCFDNCKLIEDYEDKSKLNTIYDFMNEDNFYVKYFCDRLEGNMIDFQKKYYGLKYSSRNKYKRCKMCGKMIEIKSKKDFSTKYCNECLKNIIKEQTRLRVQKYRKKICNGS